MTKHSKFDTLDHSILLKRLQVTFGLRGCVLKWFTSYLTQRYQAVCIDGVISDPCLLSFGVPQGSVLGPVLFTLYSQPLSDVISSHQCSFHKYADDTELSKSAPPDVFHSAKATLQSCTRDVHSWMNSNKLKLNTDKTEAMLSGAENRLADVDRGPVPIADSSIPLQRTVKYLGVRLDENLNMENRIGDICRSAYLSVKRIASIRPFLSETATARLVQASVISHLDYCNSVLTGIPDKQIQRLERVQNDAARLILKKRKRDHITPLLIKLHWLPVSYRIQFKVACLAYRHFDKTLPSYLSSSLTTYKPSRPLRSASQKILDPPTMNMKTVGERSFSFMAPSIWNDLPTSIRNTPTLTAFKSKLKTHLFKKAFPHAR